MAEFRTTEWRSTAIGAVIAIVVVVIVAWWWGAFDRTPEAPSTEVPQPEGTQP